ncbi:MAG: hypothetical protein HKUEN07_17910 [Rhodocyclaceae bacterium]|uniref:TonB C-terminal domain-containing protein n=1 Tax=Candidatus Desulfobacillus denitrificans TaxID=2608985 RepID=A0A809RWD3_9PROT|nr:energy transducer TonB [Rhodocyclaceae bacterium]OQY73490.1 MAG: hypothetical protein B6D47_03645 [Rhodocyclaceae bacterium UTPRO2]BBO20687.1 conserved hypothetical protein [Candidatus Desulfobacillus denitrificans]GIK44255.1 MAG: hypothetical protein BroJett012_01580 [Betaproteobacteria bacterium]GJQ55222.1 MAG: hypothetical protein HKUEN07_17910 [Rhodocyclaceae bacterium]
MPSRRLLLALAASLVLHLCLLGLGVPGEKVSPRGTAISARLLPPALVKPAQPLLKDTLAEAATPPAAAMPPTAVDTTGRRPARPRQAVAAQRKLSEVLFYPPEAVARGLEGEVRVLLTLDADGRILDAQVAAGSGHRLLDIAAVQAALAMGSLPDTGSREIILPVVFRLR